MQAISVCINYSDYLEISLPFNRPFFDKYTVVTAASDEQTLALCKQFECTPLILDIEQDYVKKSMMSQGLQQLQARQWIQILDADIVLPPEYSNIVNRVESLDRNSLYGCQRLFCQNKLVWDLFGLNDLQCYEPEENVRAIGVGFFQLFHASAQHLTTSQDWYAVAHGMKAADMSFRAKFPASSIQQLPIKVVHLGPPSTNWYGRRSPQFR